MDEKQQRFETKLPARITGLVFWGLVFVGLLLAVIVLQSAEKDLIIENHEETLILAYAVEELVEQYSEVPALDKVGGRIRATIIHYMNTYDFNAVRIYEDNLSLSVGVIDEDSDIYKYEFSYVPSNTFKTRKIQLEIYYPSSKTRIAQLRKTILLSIGLGVFIFGLTLQRILQKMLSEPFNRMVDTAESFSQGNKEVRFDEKRSDEFGYLGRFINNAIDSILSHQNDLMVALERAANSEIALSEEKERADVTLYSITDTVVTVDVDEHIVYMNPAGEILLGVKAEDVIGKNFQDVFDIVEELTGDGIINLINQCFTTGETFQLSEHASLINMNQEIISIEASIAPMKSASDDLIGAVIVIQDVSNTRRLTKQLSYQASHDLLTGLYNRRKFEEYLEELLMNVAEEGRSHSLLYMDLDNFKIVNDTCGHVAGDELLKQLPSLFHEVLRSGDVVARLGGDEFGIILENCSVVQAADIADKLRQQIKDYRFLWDDKTFEIGVSIGVVEVNTENSDMANILSSADIACYAAKDSGRNRVHIYESSDAAVSERYGQMHWTARISQALEEGRFQLFQQPIVCVIDRNRDHHEILLRMIDEEGRLIPPGAFMPAAERYGLMPDIDRWVIREVFCHMGRDDPADPIKGTDRIFAINLSGDSISDNNLFDYIIEQKNEFDISLANVCFEITETVAISNLTKASVFINELKNYGCKFALDDFGSGLSSFAYLKNLPVNYLKIDGGFVKDICTDAIDRAMVESIQQVGSVMKLKTIAEHVEDQTTFDMLIEIGVDFVQGYHLGRPEAIENDD